jgi:hypothetical protein
LQYIEIEYSQELKPLEAVLSGVKQPGDFFVCCAIEMPMPRVEVERAGTLSFPVPDAQIAALVRRAQRAPYGRGEETIVNTSIRNVWQIAPRKVEIGGKSWAANFENIHPAERIHRFRLRKERRCHLHNMIDRHRLDMTHMTERVGSPQTLVCTKDRRTFDRRMKQYDDEIAAMRTLMKMAPKLGVAGALCKRMQVAVRRADNTEEPCRG